MGTLADYISQKGISQRELARTLGLSKSYMSELVHGGKTPSLATALRIQQATSGEVSLASLIKSPSTPHAQEAE